MGVYPQKKARFYTYICSNMTDFRQSTRSQPPAYQYAYGDKTVSGVCLQNIFDYSPFGVILDGRTMQGDGYRYGFGGMEKDDELKGERNSYTTEFRQLDPRVGRWLSLDPFMTKFPWQSPYCSMDNKPIFHTDPDGRSTETTIVGKNGKVIEVINDGKTDIVQFDVDDSKWQGKGKELLNTGKGKIVGQTIFWHDFMKAKASSINEFEGPAYGEKVLNNSLNIRGDNFNGKQIANASINMYKDLVKDYDMTLSLVLLAKYSRNKKIFDLKASLPGYSAYSGVYMYTQNHQKVYTSLRVLGNMVFGANMEIARQQSLFPLSKSDFWKTAMVYVGTYNMTQNNVQGKRDYPFYGEHILSGRAIWLGYYGTKYPTK
jgi:RHS repeat-associated protein